MDVTGWIRHGTLGLVTDSIAPTPAQRAWNISEGVFRRWDEVRDRTGAGNFLGWSLATFIERVFPDWTVRAFIESDNEAAVCLTRDSATWLMPIFWPEGDAGAVNDAYDLQFDLRSPEEWKEWAFDAAISDSYVAETAAQALDGLLRDNLDGRPMLRAALAAEAAVLSLPLGEREGTRTLVALAGVPVLRDYVNHQHPAA